MLLLRMLFISFSLFCLVSCSTNYRVEKKENEKIISLAVDKDNFYVMGSHHDYQFPRKYTAQLERLVQSPYALRMTYIEASGSVMNNKEVKGSITLFVSPNDLTPAEQKDLVDNYGFRHLKDISKNTLFWKNPALVNALEISPELLRRDYRLNEGQVVNIQNHQQLTQNHSLSKPITINVNYIQSSSEFSGKNAASVIALPVIIVAAIPVYLIWGAMCSNNGC